MVESVSVKRCPSPDHAGPRELPVTKFSPNRTRPDGLMSWCKACMVRVNHRWKQNNPEKASESQRRTADQVRDQVFGHYGRVCACPGCGATENLTIDHVNGGGRAHRIELYGRGYRSAGGVHFYRWLIAQGFPDGYQVLCNSCNDSKGEGPACQIEHASVGLKRCTYQEHVGPNPLPVTEFHKSASKRGGLKSWCKPCSRRQRYEARR